MTTFRTTLRRLANEQDADERLRLSDTFASELELAFNRQGNQNQVALSDTEEVLLTKIDRLQEQVGNNNTLISTFLTAFPAQLGKEIRAAMEETARGLGKEIQELKDGQAAYNARLDEMNTRHGGQWEQAMTFLAESKEDRADLRRHVEDHERRLAEIERILRDRPSQRKREQDALVDAIAERLRDGNA